MEALRQSAQDEADLFDALMQGRPSATVGGANDEQPAAASDCCWVVQWADPQHAELSEVRRVEAVGRLLSDMNETIPERCARLMGLALDRLHGYRTETKLACQKAESLAALLDRQLPVLERQAVGVALRNQPDGASVPSICPPAEGSASSWSEQLRERSCPEWLLALAGAMPQLSDDDLEHILRAAALNLLERTAEVDQALVASALLRGGVQHGKPQRHLMKSCGQLLKKLAKKKGLAPDKVAAQLGIFGFSASAARVVCEVITFAKQR